MDITNEAPREQLSVEQPQPEFPSPNNPPWNGWIAFGVWLLSVFFIVAVPNLFLIPYLISRGISFSDKETLLEFILTDPNAIVVQLAPIILAHLLTLGLAWWVVTRFNRYPFRKTLGWEWNGFKIWHAVVIFIGFYALAFLTTAALGDVENDFERMIKTSRTTVYLVAFFATFTAPLVEEVVYRGLLYSAFQRRFGIVIAVIFTTFLFTVVHVPQYSQNSTPDYATVILLLLLGFVLTLIRVKTNNLLPCIVLHTLFNGLQSILLIIEPYFKTGDVPETGATILQLLN